MEVGDILLPPCDPILSDIPGPIEDAVMGRGIDGVVVNGRRRVDPPTPANSTVLSSTTPSRKRPRRQALYSARPDEEEAGVGNGTSVLRLEEGCEQRYGPLPDQQCWHGTGGRGQSDARMRRIDSPGVGGWIPGGTWKRMLWLTVLGVCGMRRCSASFTPKAVSALVIGGNFTLNGKSTNVAQYDPASHNWYTRFEPQLYLYGKAAGEVSDLAVWRSDKSPYDLLYVVGSFDTICKACQQQYCSAGVWTGEVFDKIGDGLCAVPRATETTMKMMAGTLTPKGDFFVGGTFQSRVWSGEKFVNVQNVAVYNPRKDAWLPLQKNMGGGLGCNWGEARVMSLAWNDRDGVLYIGGKFNMVDREYIQPGLAIWSNSTGIAAFPGGGVSFNTPWWGDSDWVYDGVVTSLIYDDQGRSLYVAGTFDQINGEASCQSIAVWRVDGKSWACLYEPQHSFSVVTSLLYTNQTLYAGGVPRNESTWPTNGTQHVIARMSQSPASFKGKFYWEWLPGFSGVPGRINELGGGKGIFSNSVFIGGDFNPPVLVWTDEAKYGPTTTSIGEEGELQGVVMSIAQMDMPPEYRGATRKYPTTESGGVAAGVAKQQGVPKTGVEEEPEKQSNHALLMGMIILCVTLGVCLGASMAFFCHRQEFMNVPWLKDMVEGRNGISLTTLAGSHNLMVGMENEFRERFRRAMQARHLTKGHNLNVINPKEIMLHRIIGEGSFGRVAVKEFVFAQAAIAGGSLQRNELIEEIVGEAAIMSFLRHPRILHLYGCSLTSQAIWIVSELCSRGSLRQVLDDRGGTSLPTGQRLQIAVDVAEGMLYLHSRDEPIIHRDLKSHNVFIQEDADGTLHPKIGDWGSARAVALYTDGMRSMTHGVGTACWLAPEVIKHAKGSEQADVYAFGIMLWELATREEVHQGLSAAQIIARVANDGLRPNPPGGCPWHDVMVACWHENPLKRPTFQQIVDRLTGVQDKLGEIPPSPAGARFLEPPELQSLVNAEDNSGSKTSMGGGHNSTSSGKPTKEGGSRAKKGKGSERRSKRRHSQSDPTRRARYASQGAVVDEGALAKFQGVYTGGGGASGEEDKSGSGMGRSMGDTAGSSK